MNKMENHKLQSTKMEISKSNGLFCILHPNLPKTSFAHKMNKNKEHT